MFFIQVQKARSVSPLEYRLAAFTCSEFERAQPPDRVVLRDPVPTGGVLRERHQGPAPRILRE